MGRKILLIRFFIFIRKSKGRVRRTSSKKENGETGTNLLTPKSPGFGLSFKFVFDFFSKKQVNDSPSRTPDWPWVVVFYAFQQWFLEEYKAIKQVYLEKEPIISVLDYLNLKEKGFFQNPVLPQTPKAFPIVARQSRAPRRVVRPVTRTPVFPGSLMTFNADLNSVLQGWKHHLRGVTSTLVYANLGAAIYFRGIRLRNGLVIFYIGKSGKKASGFTRTNPSTRVGSESSEIVTDCEVWLGQDGNLTWLFHTTASVDDTLPDRLSLDQQKQWFIAKVAEQIFTKQNGMIESFNPSLLRPYVLEWPSWCQDIDFMAQNIFMEMFAFNKNLIEGISLENLETFAIAEFIFRYKIFNYPLSDQRISAQGIQPDDLVILVNRTKLPPGAKSNGIPLPLLNELINLSASEVTALVNQGLDWVELNRWLYFKSDVVNINSVAELRAHLSNLGGRGSSG